MNGKTKGRDEKQNMVFLFLIIQKQKKIVKMVYIGKYLLK
jgi:hypothetical protein